MCLLQDLTRAVTCRHNDKIKRACTPLFDYFNLCDFWHYRIKSSGHFYHFAVHVSWTEYSASKECYLVSPYHRHPKFFQSGVSFLRTVPEELYLQMLDTGRDKFNVNPCFQLINKTPDGLEAFGFSSSSPNPLQAALLLNELPLLRLFIKKFREDNGVVA